MKPSAAVDKSPLRTHTARAQARQKRLAIALVAVLGFGAAGMYLPMRRALDAKRVALAKTETELSVNQERAAKLPQLVAEVNGLRRQVDQFKPLRGPSDVERAMHEISAINAATQLKDYKLLMPAVKPHQSCIEQPLTIAFEADFIDAMSFVQKIEAMDRLTRVRSLTMRNKDASKPGVVVVNLSLSLFFSGSD